MIEQADRPFASESFGTTAQEQEEGETLEQRLGEERPSKPPLDRQLAIEDFDAPDEEKQMFGLASVEHDRFMAPEEAAMTVSDRPQGPSTTGTTLASSPMTNHPRGPER